MQTLTLPAKPRPHPTTMARDLCQHIRRSMMSMPIQDRIECLYDLDRLLMTLQAEQYEDAEEAGVLVPNPDSY